MADSTPSQYTIMTNAALALIKQLVDSKNRIRSFRAVASDANHFTDDQEAIAEMTAIDSVKQDGVIQDIQDDGDAKSYIQIDFDQSKIDTAYQLQTVGLFATDEKGKEILYAVECLEHPQYMDVSQTMDMNSHFIHIVVGNTQQLDVSLTPAGTVSVAQMKSTLADYPKIDEVKSLIPATVIDGSKPADFKESVTLEKGAVDGAGNAIATTKNLADGDATTLKSAKAYADTKVSGKADDSTVVHTADMRKPASDVAGIEEVNAKQDKIGYTPADDSKVVHSTVTILNSTDMDTVLTAGFYQSISGTNGIPSGDNWTIYQVIPLSSVNGVQVAYETNNAILGMRSWNGGSGKISFTSWVQFADDSKVVHNSEIDPSVMVKTTLTAADDVLNLADGTYRVWQVVPKNLPAIGDGSGSDWGYVTVKSISAGTRWVEYTNIFRRRRINVYSGSPATWSGWYMPNENSVVKDNGDSTVTVDGRKFVPADTDHTIPVSEAGVAGPANFAAGTLKVDDLEVLGAKVFSDTEDYKTFAAAHPSAITIVTHNTSTS
ncbi:pyocin knob domain-containing protein [Levilactobacillus brevis]|uniref:pyocin knob domain-containing protein n=1 Tax=Levilactobacillus brevis TaxID=1580 RepID=UPI003EB6E979